MTHLTSRTLLEIQLKGALNSAPTAFRIFAAGENESTKGTWLFDAKAAKAVMAAHADRGVDIPIDYGHGTTDPMGMLNPAESGKAAGWCSLEVRDGELWAVNVRWTKSALAAIEAKEWRYISPTFSHDKEGRPEVIWAVALENVPALYSLEPLVAASATAGGGRAHAQLSDEQKKIATFLGMKPEDALRAARAEAQGASMPTSLTLEDRMLGLTDETAASDPSHLTPEETRAGLSPANAATLRMMRIAPAAFVAASIKRLIDDPDADPGIANVIRAARIAGKNPEDLVALSFTGGRPHLVLRPGARL